MPFDGITYLPVEARIMDAALDILGQKGERWIQGEFADDSGGHCMVGAIRLARRRLKPQGDKTTKLLGQIIEKDYKLFGNGRSAYSQLIQGYNDQPGRTFTEVKIIMRKALHDAIKRQRELA
jgi:hypothetical protein